MPCVTARQRGGDKHWPGKFSNFRMRANVQIRQLSCPCSRLAIEKIYFLFGYFLAKSKEIIIDERALNISQFLHYRLKGIVTCAPAGSAASVSFFRF